MASQAKGRARPATDSSKPRDSSNRPAAPSTSQLVPSHRSARAPLRKRALKTKDLLIASAKSLFLTLGYGATTIDDIVETAKVSRASFYTYFSSKREIMIVAGHESRHLGWRLFEELGELDTSDLRPALRGWLERYFDYLEAHGGYQLVWQQASLQDEELRSLGMRGQQKALRILCTSMRALGARGAESDLIIQALAVRSMLERFWYHWWVTKAPFKLNQVLDNLVAMLIAIIQLDTIDTESADK